MSQLKQVFLIFFAVFLLPYAVPQAKAQESDNIAIYGTACEPIKDDYKSSVRVRATDKACFLGVSTIPDLVDFSKNMSEHDYNIMVYSVVDNMIEDLTVKTLKQSEEEMCVEITGFVKREDVFGVVNNYIEAKEKETTIELEPGEVVVNEPIEPQKVATKEPSVAEPLLAPLPIKSSKATVYVPPLEFYDNTRSSQYAQIIKNLFLDNQYIELTNSPEQADYIVTAKVMRAKVEEINSENSRMQMVISVDLEVVADQSHLSENQNRFVLFSKSDNEQEVASKLMRRLLEKAGTTIRTRIEKDASRRKKDLSSGPVITPATGRVYQVE